MSQETRTVIEAYAQSHDPKYFAEDAVFTQMALSQPFNGRDAIGGMLRLFYHDAFSDATGELRHVAADTEKGLGFIEFTFRGRHTGELMGIQPTGLQVEVPMLGVYEIGSGQIQRGRLYYDMATLMRQLGKMP
jgi:predicted ester cyclase